MLDELFEYAISKLQATRLSPTVPCKICGADARPFDVVDFYKSCDHSLYPSGLCSIPVMYRLCSQCGFIFTNFFDAFNSEQWKRYVYNEEYIKVDPEYPKARPRRNARDLLSFLVGKRRVIIGLDYGGGNGLTASLMREHGWTFDSYDPFGHTDTSLDRVGHYNFCSAIEVFEHTPDPVESLRTIVSMARSDSLMIWIGTGISDGVVSEETRLAWWYAAPRNGHISLYSRKSLSILAAKFGLTYNNFRVIRGTHLLTRGISSGEVRVMLLRGKFIRRARAVLKLWRGNLA